MRVLITGGYGFIGSFVSERFYREGHEVIIIDNMSTGNVKNINHRHTSYISDVESPACASIFARHEIDIVIHLAAQINIVASMENPYADTKSNILGLTNILQLSAKHGIKKFIFASSAAVYGAADEIPLSEALPCRPISPYGINKLLGEYYCDKWHELYGLNTLSFRFANVYGPRQGTIGEGGVISTFMNRIRSGQKLSIYGSGEQTRDFIYVEDVADAIFTASRSEQSGVMNLSTGTENSLHTLVNILKQLHPLSGVVKEEPRSNDVPRSVLDNSLLRKTLHWQPKYSLEQGLKRTYDWFILSAANPFSPTSPIRGALSSESSHSLLNEENIREELLASSLSRHIRSLYLSQGEHYLNDTPVLKPDIFAAVIRSREQAKQKFNVDFALLYLPDYLTQNKEALQNVNDSLRETDYLGLSEDGRLLVLLSNVSAGDAKIVAERLKRQAIAIETMTSSDMRREIQI